jgi:serralysin
MGFVAFTPGLLANRHAAAANLSQAHPARPAKPKASRMGAAMQLNLTNIYSAAALGVPTLGGSMGLVTFGGTARLIYSPADVNQVASLSLGNLAEPTARQTMGNMDPGHGLAFQSTGTAIRVFAFDSTMGALTASLLDSGAPGMARVVSTDHGALYGVETMTILGGDLAALSQRNIEGLQIYALSGAGTLTTTDHITDSAKSYVATVSDTATVTLGGQDYLLTLSALENGLTSYAVGPHGRATLIDSLGNHDNLAVSGAAALQVMQVAGVTYAVIASTGSSSVSVVRVNDMGCLFLTDHMVDDLSTRFARTAVLDSFTAMDRSFVVTAGTDAGVTVLELLPGGQLQHMTTGVFETGAGMEAVTGLEVAVNGTTVSIFVTDATTTRLQQIDLSIANLGGVITSQAGTATGTAQDDLIWGRAGAETLLGGAGDDFIYAGGGADVMVGGSGADVFVMGDGTARITDYAQHSDRIDLSAWGHVYTAAALTITATQTGATITLNGHTVTVEAGHSLQASSFVDADFLF